MYWILLYGPTCCAVVNMFRHTQMSTLILPDASLQYFRIFDVSLRKTTIYRNEVRELPRMNATELMFPHHPLGAFDRDDSQNLLSRKLRNDSLQCWKEMRRRSEKVIRADGHAHIMIHHLAEGPSQKMRDEPDLRAVKDCRGYLSRDSDLSEAGDVISSHGPGWVNYGPLTPKSLGARPSGRRECLRSCYHWKGWLRRW